MNLRCHQTKGRILKETLPLLAAADIHPEEDIDKSRKLVFATNKPDVQLLVLRGADVPTYVQFGAADMGISGKDTLMENGADGLYEPLDLQIAKCRLMTAAIKEAPAKPGRLEAVWHVMFGNPASTAARPSNEAAADPLKASSLGWANQCCTDPRRPSKGG